MALPCKRARIEQDQGDAVETQRPNDDVEEQDTSSAVKPGWECLPEVALENIFCYLDQKNRGVAATVCRGWLPTYSFPNLWREQRFRFVHAKYSVYGQKVQTIIERYGRFFSHVDFSFKRLVYNQIGLQHKVTAFLGLLQKHCQLNSLTLDKATTVIKARHVCRILESVRNFLGSQHHLRLVNFNFMELPVGFGLSLLQRLNAETLTSLRIRRFFNLNEERTIHTNVGFQQNLLRFTNLRTLALEYGYMSPDIMAALRTTLRGKLQELTLSVIMKLPEDRINPRPRLAEGDWTLLIEACPGLQADFQLCMMDGLDDPRLYVPPTVPLRTFYFIIYVSWEQEYCALMISHLRKHFGGSLETFKLYWRVYFSVNIGYEVARLLDMCTNLKRVTLRTRDLVPNVHLVLQTVADNRCPSLERLTIKFKYYLRIRERYKFLKQRKKYCDMIKGGPVTLVI